MRAYIGGYGQADQVAGITVVELEGPEVSKLGVTARGAANPWYLAASPDGHTVYAAEPEGEGLLSAWRVNGDELTPLGSVPAGGGPACHLTVHPCGRFVLAASYSDGAVAVHPLGADGTPARACHIVTHTGSGSHEQQRGPHPHMVTVDPGTGPDRGHVLAVDLGTDMIYRYHLDQVTGRLGEVDRVQLPPGTGPRHLAVHGDHAYVAGELASTLSVVDLAGSPPVVRATLPTDVTGGSEPSFPSAIRLSSDAQYCYVANRGPNTLAVFAIDGELSLRATVEAGGDYPWDFVLTGGYLYVVNQRTDTLAIFRLDPVTGIPAKAGDVLSVPRPTCILLA